MSLRDAGQLADLAYYLEAPEDFTHLQPVMTAGRQLRDEATVFRYLVSHQVTGPVRATLLGDMQASGERLGRAMLTARFGDHADVAARLWKQLSAAVRQLPGAGEAR